MDVMRNLDPETEGNDRPVRAEQKSPGDVNTAIEKAFSTEATSREGLLTGVRVCSFQGPSYLKGSTKSGVFSKYVENLMS